VLGQLGALLDRPPAEVNLLYNVTLLY
jgi:hypothetical protein